jgi:hypothetical protein
MVTKGEKKAPAMERAGIWYLKRLHRKNPPDRIDIKTHVLDDEERKSINHIEKWAIANVAIAGAISSIVSGYAAFVADSLNDEKGSFFSQNNMAYMGIVLGVTIVASLIEIFYIYYDVMAKAFALASAAHMELFPKDKDEELIAAPIVRAALELPNKKEKDINIDPKKESSKVVIMVAALFYKLKISVTNFILKALVKRTMGRAISRAWLNFLSVPVCAFWNGLVCWYVIREVKIRVLGPSAVNELFLSIEDTLKTMSDRGTLALLRAIGSSIVRTADLHPNLEYMFRAFTSDIKEPENAIFDDTKLFLEDLKNLEEKEREIVLQTLVYACIIDGKINYREKKLLQHAYLVCNVPFHYNDLKSLLKRFRNGQLLEFDIRDHNL